MIGAYTYALEQEIKRLRRENLRLSMKNEELKSKLIDDRPRDPSLLGWSQDLPTIDSGYQE